MHQVNHDQVLSFHTIPQEYNAQMKSIEGIVLKQLYSKFSFNYLNFSSVDNSKEAMEIILANYLQEFKLITIEITSNQKSKNNEKAEISSQKVNSIICFEGNCLIIEDIELNIIMSILKETKSTIYNVSECDEYKCPQISKDEDINNFCNQFISTNSNKNNKFVKLTIKPIITYLMQRYYFPSNYFKDPFFL
ncbi:hypothetical protein M9Y10_040418 [Tritrichomonas musculus]|uniref:Uncharacterized protein n=1 Tax=Tritrichomonas musculus TaxID=1915356 RepID=A0ABR2GR56_9EUKA